MNQGWGRTGRKIAGRIAVAAIFAAVALPPVPAAAQIPVPADCRAIATVLQASCNATTLLDCGVSREAHTYQKGELQIVRVFTPDWKLTEFRDPGFGDMRMTAVPGTVSNTNIPALLSAGWSQESGRFTLSTRMIDNRSYVLSGYIELTGETEFLGGVRFQKARIHRSYETDFGAGGMEFEIDMYVSAERDLMFEAAWSRSVFGSKREYFAYTPFGLAWPGQEGFMAAESEADCD
ncbi:hypothetical protein AB9K34_03075 [Sedimentitalea sp. XS_ASV28]|uniref:hypothetical protein n=1 Tax=Sedimentitalea sp. XS_ASV28 TaxID=3241296 RepID=UPI0035154BD4